MSFIKGIPGLPAKLVRGTGTYINFLTSQLTHLPEKSSDVAVEFPDGTVAAGRFTLNRRNPYIGGPEVVRWIKSVHSGGDPIAVEILAKPGDRIAVRIQGGTGLSKNAALRRRLQAAIESSAKDRKRVIRDLWERDPRFRKLALSVWGPHCQVIGCMTHTGLPSDKRDAYAHVHHLDPVSAGGSDSAANACVVCANHHNLFHRSGSVVTRMRNADEAQITAGGQVYVIKRDMSKLL
jgi:hypothetical protein